MVWYPMVCLLLYYLFAFIGAALFFEKWDQIFGCIWFASAALLLVVFATQVLRSYI